MFGGGGGELRPLGVGGVIFLTVFGLFWWGMVGLFDVLLVSGCWRQARATRYATTTGVVTQSNVRSTRSGKSTNYVADLRYRYEVAGRPLSGTRYRYDFANADQKSAYAMVAARPVGAQVTVYYDPTHPADSLLQPGLDGGDLFFAMFLVPFNLACLLLAYILGSGVRELVAPSATGGCRLWDDGLLVRVRMPVVPPLVWGLAAGGGAAFVAIFVVAVAASGHPSMAAMGVTWAAILAAAAVAYVARRRRAAAGEFDLLLDPIGRTMTLPRMLGRKEEMVVAYADVGAIEVERVFPARSDRNRYYEYYPTLVLAGRDGAAGRERIGRWRDGVCAQRFADWLRQRMA
jgi:hypothetical protein